MFVITVPYLNLDKIYESGQAIRWKKLKKSKYVIIDGKKAVKVEQQKDRFLFHCSEEEFYDIWFKYFDMNKDYEAVSYKLRQVSLELKICNARARGVRIIKTNLLESLFVAFLIGIGVKNPYSKINLLSTLCGPEHRQSMREDGVITWFEFPSPEEILEKRDTLKSQYGINFDYKVGKLLEFCDYINEGWLDLEVLLKCKTEEEIKDFLSEFEWFNEQAINYLCLHSSLDIKTKPIINDKDRNALEIIMNCDLETFMEWYEEDIKDVMEYVLQFIIYNSINPPTERELERWERT